MKKTFLIMSVLLFGITITGITSCGTDSSDTGSVSFVIDGAQIARLAEASALKTGTFSLQAQSLEDATGPLTGDTSADDIFVKHGWYFFPADDPEFSSKTLSEWYVGSSNNEDDNLLEVNSLFLFKDNTFLTTVYKAKLTSLGAGEAEKRLEFQGEYTIGEAKTVPGDNTTVTMTPLTLSIKKQWNKTSSIWASAEADMTINASVTEITMEGKTSKALEGTLGDVTKTFVKISGQPGETSADDTKSGMTLTIALPGSGQKAQTLTYTPDDMKAGKKQAVTFDDIPADSTVRALATLTAETSIDGESLTSLVAYGFSESSKIIAGSNSLTLPMQTVSALSTKELVSKNKKPFSGTDARGEEYLLYVFKSKSQTGDWAIVYENAIVSAGSYTILSTNDNNNPASLSLTEFIYLDPKDEKYHTVAAPQAKTYPVEDGKLSITGTNGVQLTFTVSENDEPKPEPEPQETNYTVTVTYKNVSTNESIQAEKTKTFTDKNTASDIETFLNGLLESDVEGYSLSAILVHYDDKNQDYLTATEKERSDICTAIANAGSNYTVEVQFTPDIPAGGSIGIDSQIMNIEIDGTFFYRNQEGTITFSVTDTEGNAVTDDVTYSAQLLYKGRDLNELGGGSTYYEVDSSAGKLTMYLEENPFPQEGLFQLFVTATRNAITSSQTFDVTILSKTLLYVYEIDETNGKTIADTSFSNDMDELSADIDSIVIAVSGNVVENQDDMSSSTQLFDTLSTGLSDIRQSVAFDFSELTGITDLDHAYLNGDVRAFEEENLTSVILPSSLETVSYLGEAPLTSITIPAGVTSLSLNKDTLKEIIIDPDNEKYKSVCNNSIVLETTDGGAKSVTLVAPASSKYATLDFSSGELAEVTQINDHAFNYASNLKTITSFGNVTSIGEETFAYCDNLTSITSFGNVTSLGVGAFKDCSKLTSIGSFSKLESISERAFYGCSSLANVDFTGIKTIEHSGFWGTGFTELNLTGVTTLKNYAFASCNNLTEVTLSNVTSFGTNIYEGCTKLGTVTIGDGVTQIGSLSFVKCDSLSTVTFKNANNWSSYTSSVETPTSVDVTNPAINATNLKAVDINNGGAWFNVTLKRTE